MVIKFNEKNNQKLKRKKIKLLPLAGSIVLSSILLSGCNKAVIDTKYGFDKALIFGDDTSIVMDVESWNDYDGEQLQLITKDNFVLLSSSFDTNCFYGNSDQHNAQNIGQNALSDAGELYNFSKDDSNRIFNKELFDTNWSFNKSITFNGNRALILPIQKWRDYEGEQLQLITNNGLVLNLSSLNTKLVLDEHSEMKASDFASYYIGSDGIVSDLSTSGSSIFNYDIIDTKFNFNKAIILKDNSAVILPVLSWCDYEGEQLQIKIIDGPTILTSSYDTILVNDINSPTKAHDIATMLTNGPITDYTEKYQDTNSLYNGTLIDLNYGFTNGIISNDNSATSISISKWNDYEGEQLQIKLPTGDTILTSSMFLDLINSGSSQINSSTLANAYIDSVGKVIDNTHGNTDSTIYNGYVVDTAVSFKYALKVCHGNVTIIPLKSWQDFNNTAGKKSNRKSPFPQYYTTEKTVSFILDSILSNSEEEEEEKTAPNCEQLQLILPDNSSIVTTSYDTILVNNVLDIKEIAEMFRGPNGTISDLTPYVGEPNISIWNKNLFDIQYQFSYAVLTTNDTAQVFKIKTWQDFAEGEQLQLSFEDNSGFLTSFTQTILISPKTEFLEETIAAALTGTLENDQPHIKTYK